MSPPRALTAALGTAGFYAALLAPFQPAPAPPVSLVVNAFDATGRTRVRGVEVRAVPGTVGVTDSEGRTAVFLPVGYRDQVALTVRWPDGCVRGYTWLQTSDAQQVIYVARAECAR